MNFDALFAQYAYRTVRAGLIGAGQFGASFIAQTIRTPILDVPLLCDLEAERAVSAFAAAGYADEDIVIANSSIIATAALEKGGALRFKTRPSFPNFQLILSSKRRGTRKRLSPLAWRPSTRGSIS